MSPVWSRRVLWAVLLLTLPVPIWFIGGGRVPTLALFQISAYVLPVWLSEGGPGAALAIQGLGIQGVVWAAVLYVGARLVVRLLTRLGGGKTSVVGLVVVIVGLFVVSMFPVYVAPIIARGAPVSLLNVY